MTISEYDGPTAWADMSAIEKMQGVLIGEFTDVDELALYRQAIEEAALAERRHADVLDENRTLRAEVERLRVNAGRYEWLRAHWFTMTSTIRHGKIKLHINEPRWLDGSEADVDAAIDAARGVKS